MTTRLRLRRYVAVAIVVLIALAFLLRFEQSAPHSTPVTSHETIRAHDVEATGRPLLTGDAVDAGDSRRRYMPDQLLVQFRESVAERRVRKIVAGLGGRIIETFKRPGNLVLIKLPDGLTPIAARKRLGKKPEIEAAEPNYIYYKQVLPNDPFFDKLWGLNNPPGRTAGDYDINAPEAWETTTGDTGVYIGVIDTGIDYQHEDLVDNVWVNPGEIASNGIDDDNNGWVDDVHGYDFVNNDPDPMDDEGHGTHVSGTIAATGNNGIGYTGVMWRATIISCKFLNADGFGLTSDAVSCLNYFGDLKDSGIDIVATNNSWGGGANSPILNSAIEAHAAKGIIFVAAAGNDGVNTDDSPSYPASFDADNIVSVAAMTTTGQLADFSNFGPASVDIAAPGVAVWSTLPGDRYGSLQGTSMAAPHVTGVIGLIKASDPLLTSTEIQSWLLSHGTPDGQLLGKVTTGAYLRAELPPTDSDLDGMPDRWEEQYGLDPQNPADAALDQDADGLSNLDEFINGTEPNNPDTDGDGLTDGEEVNTYATDPTSADSDGDGIGDFEEVSQFGTDPAVADTDLDGLSDGDEINTHATDPLDPDTDGDGLPDGWEVEFGFDPLQTGEEIVDSDGDGLNNAGEYLAGSNPSIVDSDDDGLLDGEEVNTYGTNPVLADSDSDGMSDGWELRYGLDPVVADDADLDSDGDGFSNFEEYLGGTDPTSAAAVPPHTPWSNRNGDASQGAHAPMATDATAFTLAWQLATDGTQTGLVALADGHMVVLERQYSGIVFKGVDLITGDVAWSRPMSQLFGGVQSGSLSGAIVIGGDSQQTIATSVWLLDTITGKPLKTIPLDENQLRIATIATAGDTLVARYDDELLSVDTTNSRINWRTPLVSAAERRLAYPPAINDSYVVAVGGNTLFVYDRNSGVLRYSLSSTCDNINERTIMIDAQNRAFVVGTECVWAVDLDSEQTIWQIDRDFRDIRPSMDASTLFVGYSGRLRAIDKATGATSWDWQEASLIGDNIVSSLTHVFIESWSGIYAINKATRVVEWLYPLSGSMTITDEGMLIVQADRDAGYTAINISGDSDGDGLPDNWERRFKLNQLDASDVDQDADNDGLSNREEFTAKTNPTRRDSDGDGIGDYDEMNVFGTDARRADSDDDGLTDGDEITVYRSNPLVADTDRDGVSDGDEVNEYGTDPVDDQSRAPVIDNYNESFESGPPVDWIRPAYASNGWSVLAGSATDGSFSLVSAALADSQRAIVEWSGDFVEGDLVFDARFDKDLAAAMIAVYLDDAPIVDFHNSGWEQEGIRIPKGLHTVRFEFHNGSAEAARAMIDNVRFRVPLPVASNANNVLAFSEDRLWEFDLGGNAVRLPITIPAAIRPRQVVVSDEHKIVITDAPFLHFFDPIANRFTKKFVGQWAGSTVVPHREGFVLNNYSGSTTGLILLDADGIFEGQVMPGAQYTDIHAGLDGYLYGLRGTEAPAVDRISLQTFTVLSSINVQAGARTVAADADGAVYVAAFGRFYLKYDANGNLLRSLQDGSGIPASGPAVTRSGNLFFGGRRSEILVSMTDLAKLDRFPVQAPSHNQGDRPVDVAVIPLSGNDSDQDGIPDWWEYGNAYDPFDAMDALIDVDSDGLNALGEYLNQTDPNLADTDFDGLDDGAEANIYFTSPLRADSDGDQLSDFDEISIYSTDPNLADTDADGLQDSVEVTTTNTDPLAADTDNDGMTDGWEFENGLNPLSNTDAGLDPDADGLQNLEEFNNNTDILKDDTDGDDLRDGDEVNVYRTDPNRKDTDNDWLHDGWEVLFSFDPLLGGETEADPDGDGFTNRDEFFSGTDPTDGNARPRPTGWAMHQGNAGHTGYVPVHIEPAAYKELWTNRSLAGMSLSGPATVDNGIVAITGVNTSGGKLLHALSALDGSISWSLDFANIDSLSPPTAANGALFVQSEQLDSGALHKITAATGTEEFQTPVSIMYASRFAPTAFGGAIFAPYEPVFGGIASYRSDAPGWDWSVPLAVGSIWAFAVDPAAIYAATPDGLAVVGRTSGSVDYVVAWPRDVSNIAGGRSTVVDRFGRVFVIVSQRLVAFDTETRSVAWEISNGDFEGLAAFASGMLFAIESGSVVAIDERDGSEIWRWAPPNPIQSNLVVTSGHVYVSTYAATYALNRQAGTQAWIIPASGNLSIDAQGTLYVAGFSGEITAYAVSTDRDGDGMPDDWEDFYGLDADDPVDASLDPDNDTLTSLDEFIAGTDPTNADTDGDTLPDALELQSTRTDPNLADTDADGLDDDTEVNTTLTDPNDPDSDGDRLADGEEVNVFFTDPFAADTDGDGIGDFEEARSGSDPLNFFSTPQQLGMVVESFEGNTLPPGWSVPVDSEFGWRVTSGDATDGSNRLESDGLTFPTKAVIEFTGNLPAGRINLDLAIPDNRCCVEIAVFVDNDLRIRAARSEWQHSFATITAGIQTIRFEFVVQTPSPGSARFGVIDLVTITPDRDYDFMPDAWEVLYGLDPDYAGDGQDDLDSDGLVNRNEYLSGTLPNSGDTDNDGMLDGYEVQYGLDPNDASDANGDPDGDGLDNITEFGLLTSPISSDSDNDGMPDGYEVANGFNPASRLDGSEDPDGDGLTNAGEYSAGTSPFDADSDADTLPDGWEAGFGLDPLDATDATDDPDGDTLSNLTEYGLGTNPGRSDSDNDGMPDNWEVDNSLDPLVDDAGLDPDGDGASNLSEYQAGTDPHVAPPPPPPPGQSSGGGGSTDLLLIGFIGLACWRRRRTLA